MSTVIATLEEKLADKRRELIAAKDAMILAQQKVETIETEINDLQRGLLVFKTNGNVKDEPRPVPAKQDAGREVAVTHVYGGNTVVILKKVLVEMMARICEVPRGQWFRAGIIRPVISSNYNVTEKRKDIISAGYLQHLIKNNIIVRNERKGSGRKYQRPPGKGPDDKTLRQRIEEERKLMADMLH